ncbi:pro-interleukin-16 isoform X2 [Cephus cinctus]|uniref:Pro-interleukin-16 isoform X2 n=1 Tax=Cephus cinctus TaxID=211228 RepID=A0AAJ7CFK1_CEPCN|nr:pro-interleukin-16 isoform X2 [Cephus cinctus]
MVKSRSSRMEYFVVESEAGECHRRLRARSAIQELIKHMSPVRWVRRKSSSSESERNCYNVQTSQVTTERSASKKDKKRIQEERMRICEKRNPLLDRVKNTRLSFFRDKDSDDESEDGNRVQFRSMNELSQRGLTRNEFRRSVCESDLKQISEEEKTSAKRKRRSKSQTRLPSRKNCEERSRFFGFRASTPKVCKSKDDTLEDSPKPRRRWRKSKDFLADNDSTKSIDILTVNNESPGKDESFYDSITPSSCLAAKFRAMQDRYLKSSTNRLIAKIYKKDSKDKEKRRLRSFSYGTLPGLDELRTNPLYEEQPDQDDNDSGILDNDSATSSLLDDRCSSDASGLLTSSISDASPPQLPPRRPSAPITESEKNAQIYSSLELNSLVANNIKHNSTKSLGPQNVTLGIERDPLRTICQAANSELIQRQTGFASRDRRAQSLNRKEIVKRLASSKESLESLRPQVVRNKAYTMETTVVKLVREKSDECLGIFIAKSLESNPGYLVAHVVPNGLADREGTLKIGDEILIVNGKRLRGLSMAEARKILGSGSGPGEVDIVISRYTSVDHPRRLKESSVDYENVSIENGHGVIVEAVSPKSHFRKHHSRRLKDKKNDSSRSIFSEKSSSTIDSSSQSISNFCTLPRRPRSTVCTFHTVVFEKGPGKKSLGFTIVGGRDSPKGSIGIFIKSVLPGGQAAEDGRLRAGDEILAVNGQVSHDLAHREAVQLFRNIKSGPVALHLCRRVKHRESQALKAKSCADLLLTDG